MFKSILYSLLALSSLFLLLINRISLTSEENILNRSTIKEREECLIHHHILKCMED